MGSEVIEMGRFDGKNGIVYIVDERTYGMFRPISLQITSKICDKYTLSAHSQMKIKALSRLYKFADFFDALDCMRALKNQFIKPLESRLYKAGESYYILLKSDCKSRFIIDKIALEFGKKVCIRTYPMISERAALLCDDFYSGLPDSAV